MFSTLKGKITGKPYETPIGRRARYIVDGSQADLDDFLDWIETARPPRVIEATGELREQFEILDNGAIRCEFAYEGSEITLTYNEMYDSVSSAGTEGYYLLKEAIEKAHGLNQVDNTRRVNREEVIARAAARKALREKGTVEHEQPQDSLNDEQTDGLEGGGQGDGGAEQPAGEPSGEQQPTGSEGEQPLQDATEGGEVAGAKTGKAK